MRIFCLLSPVSITIYLGWSLVQRRRHLNGCVTSAGPPHYPTKLMKSSNSWGNRSRRDWTEGTERQGLNRGNRKAESCLLSDISTRKSYFSSSWRTSDREEHTLDFSYKHHIGISKLPGRKHSNLFAKQAEISEQRTVSLGTAWQLHHNSSLFSCFHSLRTLGTLTTNKLLRIIQT